MKRREQREKKTKKKLATSKTNLQNKQENKNMTKEEELRTIYEQKRAINIWIESILKQAWNERQAAFLAWRKAVEESKAK